MDECDLPAGSPAVPDPAPDHPQSREGIHPQPPAEPADAAFSAFYRQFVPVLIGFLMWQGARLSDATELAQTTMAQAYKYWSTIREPEAWTRRVASRELVRKIASVEDPVEEVPEPSPLLPPLTNVFAWEQQHEVLRLLDLLPPRQRQVLAWSLQEFTPAEIAAELKITGEAVRASLKKARRTLAQHLGMTEDDR